jgi:hypothetical protein
LGGDLFYERLAVIKKSLVTGTQVIQSRFAIRCLDEAVLRALTVAHGPDLTLQTIAGKSIPFGMPECSLFRTFQQFRQWSFDDIPEAMFCIYEMITGEEIAIVLDNRHIPADRTKDAQRMLLPECRSGCLFEYLYFDLSDILTYPLVEDCAEKISPIFGWRGEVADSAFSVWLPVNHRQKGYISSSDLLEVPVDPDWIPDIVCIHDTQDIRRNPVLLQ